MSQNIQKHGAARPHSQRGVVLIIALIMLVIISLLASFSIRNATSSEAVSGNVRTTQLAQQAAEVALRYCETGVTLSLSPAATPTVVYPPAAEAYATTPAGTGTLAYDSAAFPRWKNIANWDGTSSVTANLVNVVPVVEVGGTATYHRMPECMVEAMQILNSTGGVSRTTTYVITARGFGPEVAKPDYTLRTRPVGSEVWLQSTIEY